MKITVKGKPNEISALVQGTLNTIPQNNTINIEPQKQDQSAKNNTVYVDVYTRVDSSEVDAALEKVERLSKLLEEACSAFTKLTSMKIGLPSTVEAEIKK